LPKSSASVNKTIESSAFTLVEVLVAMAVLSILLVVLLNVVTSTTTLWRFTENRADAFREARAALTFISRDMTSPIPLLCHGEQAKSLLTPETAADWAPNRDAVFFLAALPPSAQKSGENASDMCIVGYFVAFDSSYMSTDGTASPTMNLYRYLLSSDDTFAALAASEGWPFFSENDPKGTIKNISPASEHVDLLARNIREFHVEESTWAYNTKLPDGTYATLPLPEKVKITIIAASREAAAKFPDKAKWVTPHNKNCCALCRDEQTFTTSIPIRSKLPVENIQVQQ